MAVSDVMNGTHQFVQLFATHSSEIKKSARRLLKHAAAGALVWISYPTKTSGIASDLSREAVCEAISGTGWRAVAIVALGEVCLRDAPYFTDAEPAALTKVVLI